MERRFIVPEGMEVIRDRFGYNPGVLVGDTALLDA